MIGVWHVWSNENPLPLLQFPPGIDAPYPGCTPIQPGFSLPEYYTVRIIPRDYSISAPVCYCRTEYPQLFIQSVNIEAPSLLRCMFRNSSPEAAASSLHPERHTRLIPLHPDCLYMAGAIPSSPKKPARICDPGWFFSGNPATDCNTVTELYRLSRCSPR